MPEEIGSANAGNPEGANAPTGQATPPQAESPPAAAPPDFLASIADSDLRSWAETKGLTANEQTLNSYRNLEKIFGADKAGRTVTLLGDEPSTEEFNEFYGRLGRPKEAKGYAFSAPEGSDSAFADSAKEAFHGLGLTDRQAQGVADWWQGQSAGAVEASEAQYNEQVASDTAGLRKEWGAAYDKNVSAAQAATREFGLDEKAVDGLESTLGFGGLMKFMHKIGAKLGEDTLDGGDSNVGDGLMSPDAARQGMKELYGNTEWMTAFMDKQHPGHDAALEKKARFSRMAAGVAP